MRFLDNSVIWITCIIRLKKENIQKVKVEKITLIKL